jgi:hypothetical protein
MGCLYMLMSPKEKSRGVTVTKRVHGSSLPESNPRVACRARGVLSCFPQFPSRMAVLEMASTARTPVMVPLLAIVVRNIDVTVLAA